MTECSLPLKLSSETLACWSFGTCTYWLIDIRQQTIPWEFRNGRPVVHLAARVSAIWQAFWLELGAEGLNKVLDLVWRLRGVQRGQVLRRDQSVDHRAVLYRLLLLMATQVGGADLVAGGRGGGVWLVQLLCKLLRRGQLLVSGGVQTAQVVAVLGRRAC